MSKRLFDIVLSGLGLIALWPLMLALALIIRVSSPGPVLYLGRRVGRFGKPFHILKFRSMIVDAERLGASSTAENDDRITSIGSFMRKYKLDELPQLVNVFIGSMSLVGPRPEVQKFVDLYTHDEQIILTVRPGITDWASIWNSDEGSVLDGAPDADAAYAELIRPTKIALQKLYVKHSGIRTDTKILFATFFKLVRKSWLPVELLEYGRPETWKERYGGKELKVLPASTAAA